VDDMMIDSKTTKVGIRLAFYDIRTKMEAKSFDDRILSNSK
jgi:hypothetical protein